MKGEDVVTGHRTVKLLTDGDVPFSELVPGIELSRAITHAGTTQLGGGYMRFEKDAEFGDWTLSYDEVLFVQSGELEIVGEGGSVKAGVGEAVLIPNGAKVTYRGRAGTVGFFVLWPFDWNKKTEGSTARPLPARAAPPKRPRQAARPGGRGFASRARSRPHVGKCP